METNYYTITEKNDMVQRFLYIPKEFKRFTKDISIVWIYKIVNFKDDRVYVGKTSDLRRRALNYVNEYLKGETSRKLPKAFHDLGFQYFLMFPLEIAFTEESAEFKERYYIDKFDSIENGFNSAKNSAPTFVNRKRPSVPQTLYSKMIKSKLVAGIKTDTNEIVFATGLKLFGDLIGRSKDEIKSAAKRETRLNGYFIYYMNSTDFSKQLIDADTKIKKNSTYEDYRLQYHDFIKYAGILQHIVETEEFPAGMKSRFIIQSNGETGYKEQPVEKFFEFYRATVNRII